MTFDLVLRGGTLYDGTGSPGQPGDLGIRGDRIIAFGDASGPARRVIDVAGLAVAPGFIDIKTHSDFTLPINPKAESKVRQGVTTEVIGHCGFSVAPVLAGKVNLLADYLSPSAPWLPFREMSFPEYLDSFPATAVNACMLAGHNTLRLMVMGMDNRPPTAAELATMSDLLEEALRAGALGLSSGLFTSPGSYADAHEMIALCRVVKRYSGGYFTHIRDESNHVLEAIQEAIDIAEICDLHVQIVHFKCSGLDNWGKARRGLKMIAEAKARGVDIDCDAYPYTAGSNPLKNLLPQWVQEGGVSAMLARLALPEARSRIRADISRDGLNNWGRIPNWDCVQISISPNLPQHVARTIAELARERSADPIEVVCNYLIEDRGATRVLVSAISEEDVRDILRSPLALIGSDGNCIADYGITGQGIPHPRFYGTFPRVLGHYVHELGLLPIELALHKMTGAAARALRLIDRGLLRPGYFADVTVFDPAEFKDRATYANPHQYPTGPRTMVLNNGVPVVQDAVHTGALPGKVLRRNPARAVL
ncbi:MAG: D-aminoacylase [Bradyrhizobiaceae bacterium]|nr:D-aminoacylase [Bradyrhizobiaceae bacterium]